MDTYSKIINSSYFQIAEHGYDKCSMNKICELAEISKGSLYHHFKSKEELFVKVCEAIILDSLNQYVEEDLGLTKENFKKYMRCAGILYIRQLRADSTRKKFMLEVMINMNRVPYFKQRLMPMLFNGLKYFKKFLEKGIALGVIPSQTDLDLMTQKICLTLDAIEMYAAFRLDFNLSRIWVEFIESLFLFNEHTY